MADLDDSARRVGDTGKLALRVRKRGHLAKGVGDRGQQAIGIAPKSGAVARAVRLRKHPACAVEFRHFTAVGGSSEAAIVVPSQGCAVTRSSKVTSKDSPLRVPQAGSIPLNQQDSAALGHNLLHTGKAPARTILASRTVHPVHVPTVGLQCVPIGNNFQAIGVSPRGQTLHRDLHPKPYLLVSSKGAAGVHRLCGVPLERKPYRKLRWRGLFKVVPQLRCQVRHSGAAIGQCHWPEGFRKIRRAIGKRDSQGSCLPVFLASGQPSRFDQATAR